MLLTSGFIVIALCGAPQTGVPTLAPPASESKASAPDVAAANPSGETRELIQERFANGQIHIQREVVQDERHNYLNDGSWVEYNEQGQEVARGTYAVGKRQGPWLRKYRKISDLKMPLSETAAQFQGPFLSHATFNAGKLEGEWTITDARNRPVICWAFQDGKRQGTSTWWHATGVKWREVQFREGLLEGGFVEWSPQQQPVRSSVFLAGRQVKPAVEFYEPGVKKLDTQYLTAPVSTELGDDWATATSNEFKFVESQYNAVLHGHWTSWHANRQKASEGQFQDGRPEGAFTWWYPNGQKSCEGGYEKGKPAGDWTWWHANGQKQIHGGFLAGNQTGKWTWWALDGKVQKSSTLDEQGPSVAMTPSEDGPPVLLSNSQVDLLPVPAPAAGTKK